MQPAPNIASRLLAFALPTLVLAGCAPFASLFRPVVVAPPPMSSSEAGAAVPPMPALPVAEASHRHTLSHGQDVVGVMQTTIAGKDDTLPDLARRFNLGYEEIVRANPGVDPWLPGAGRVIQLPTQFVLPDAPREGVVINVAAMRLFYYPARKKGEPVTVFTHPIGIGKVGWATPEGRTKVVSRIKDPVWVPPLSVRQEHLKDGEELPKKVPAGPDNPLGRHMFRLGWPSYLVHGTNKPYGVGMRSSHGCIRLYPEDISRLYDAVPMGTPVTVVNQPYLLGWRGDVLYVQAYGPLEDDKRNWQHGPKSLRQKAAGSKSPLWKRIVAEDEHIDWDRAYAVSREPRGIAVPVTKGHVSDVAGVIASALRVRNTLPKGATWDGNEDQYAGEATFRELQAEKEPAARAHVGQD
jgi:L,D-transpeptidase ErfK/SrfK